MNINRKIFEKIKQYQKIAIFGHVSPDGDCYGSQCGLKWFIKQQFPQKEVVIVGSGFSKALPYFDKMDVVEDSFLESSLGVVVDVSDIERIEDQRVLRCAEVVKFDHHLKSDQPSFATINMSNTKAGSTCQMIGQFILDNHYKITKEVGERIYLGIVTDTGRFLYLNSSEGLFLVVDAIMNANIDYQKIYDFLYEGDEISTRAKGYISYTFQVSPKGVAYCVLTKEKLKELQIDYNYASSMVNVLSGMKDLPIWVTFAESETGEVRVELRSKKYNVQQVAVLFGGGGHLQAAGCKLNDINDAKEVIKALDAIIE